MAIHGTAQSNCVYAAREWNTILLGIFGEYIVGKMFADLINSSVVVSHQNNGL